MVKTSKYKYLLICFALIVVFSTTVFSASYALWLGGRETLAMSVNVGAWRVSHDMRNLTDSEIMDILRAAGCVDGNGNVQGAVTSTGQVVKFGDPVELTPGEELVIFYGGKRCTNGISTDHHTILGDAEKYFEFESADGDGGQKSVLVLKDGMSGSYVLSKENFGLISWVEVNPAK